MHGVSTPRIRDVEFLDLFRLEPHGPDTYVGIAARYPWGERLFGGQVVAQALRAAAATVDAATAGPLAALLLHPARRPVGADPLRGRAAP